VVETGRHHVNDPMSNLEGIKPWIISWMSLMGFICSLNSIIN
jgi:hypothetical protein